MGYYFWIMKLSLFQTPLTFAQKTLVAYMVLPCFFKNSVTSIALGNKVKIKMYNILNAVRVKSWYVSIFHMYPSTPLYFLIAGNFLLCHKPFPPDLLSFQLNQGLLLLHVVYIFVVVLPCLSSCCSASSLFGG